MRLGMNGLSETQRQYFQQKGAIPGSVNFLTYRFAPKHVRDPLLVLQALVAEIVSIPLKVSEPEVALAKLGWWHSELDDRGWTHSQHPIVRAGREIGLFERLEFNTISRLLIATGAFASGEPIVDRATLHDRCCALGSAEARLIAALESAQITQMAISAIGTARVLVFFMERSALALPGGSWWLPLQDQARYGVSLAEVQAGHKGEGLAASMRSLGQDAMQHIGQAARELRHAGQAGSRVLPILLGVLGRRVQRLSSRPLGYDSRNTLAEVWSAWRAATRR